jgi:hypothetical protein
VQANDSRIKSLALASLGDIERYSGRLEQAGQLYQQAIAVSEIIQQNHFDNRAGLPIDGKGV